MALNIIDFSNGIRPEEIQENFDYLQEQISRERVSVGGTGIASGLEMKVIINEELFGVEVTNGSIIDNKGDEIFIDGKFIPIEPPILYQYKETLDLTIDRTITLKHIPYSLGRRLPSQYENSYEPEVSGIVIKHKNSLYLDDYIRVRNIQDRVITVTGALLNELDVVYSYTSKRIDTIYLDNDLNIKVKQGTTSTTPSAVLPSDARFLIAYIEIDNEYVTESNNIPHANIYIKNDLRTIRNLYTTNDGTLYICGIPFDDLQIIHLKEPENPKENTLWLNMGDNTLYCWRSTDEFIYKNQIEVTTDFLEQENAELVFSTYMDFYLGQNELDVFLNDSLLVRNIDYEEISNRLPTIAGNEGEKTKGNGFRILQTIKRPDGLKDVLVTGDVLTYIIKYKDSQYMWVPINKMSYIPVKHSKVYSTWYDGINDKYVYEEDAQTKKAYFDSSVANSLGRDLITGYHNKYQYFLFHRTKDLEMHFTPDRKQLSIMINQMYLHEDQFEEITVFDLMMGDKLPLEVKRAAASHFGWEDKYIQEFNKTGNSFDNSGIGFKLIEPLDAGLKADSIDDISSDYRDYKGSNDLFVEAIVEHRVCATPVDRKLQRSATFIYEDTITLKEDFDGIVHLKDITYRFNEHQLELFADGRKLIEGTDYIEQYGYFKQTKNDDGTYKENIKAPIIPDESYMDQDYFYRMKSAVCSMFKIINNSLFTSQITYKITANVYSYDHINNILDDIGSTLDSCKSIVSGASQAIADMQETVDEVWNKVRGLEEAKEEYDPKYLTSDSILSLSQMPAILLSHSIKSLNHINTSITLKTGQLTYSLNNLHGSQNDVWAKDYINIFYHNSTNNFDSYWVRGLHYEIREISTHGQETSYLEILKPEAFSGGDIIYITGIKLSHNRKFDSDENKEYLTMKEHTESMKNYITDYVTNYVAEQLIQLINNGGDLNE